MFLVVTLLLFLLHTCLLMLLFVSMLSGVSCWWIEKEGKTALCTLCVHKYSRLGRHENVYCKCESWNPVRGMIMLGYSSRKGG